MNNHFAYRAGIFSGLGIAAVLCLAGCDHEATQPAGPYLSDDGDHPTSRGTNGDQLASAYALGTLVTVQGNGLGADPGSYDIRSDTPSVLQPVSRKVESATLGVGFRALAEGQAELQLVAPGGAVVRHAPVIVRRADRVRFYESGAARIHGLGPMDRGQAEISDAQVLVGGKAMIGVAYFRGDEFLSGSGEAEVDLDAQASLLVEQLAFSGPVNTILSVSPTTVGLSQARLTVAGTTIGALDVRGVDETAIATLLLQPEDEPTKPRSDGDEVWVLARSSDATGRAIYGAYAGFALDGLTQGGNQKSDQPKSSGDLYRYAYSPGGPARTLTATLGGHSATLPIPAKSGYVEDSTYLGCSAAPGQGRSSAAALTLALLGMLGLRRRRLA